MPKQKQQHNIPHDHLTPPIAKKQRRFGRKPTSGSIVLSPAAEQENLTFIITMLNDKGGLEHDWRGKSWGHIEVERLTRWVLGWLEVRANRREDARLIETMRLSAEDRSRLDRYVKDLRVIAQGNGKLLLDDYPNYPAEFRFNRLLNSSEKTKDRLGGPCKWDACEKKWYERRTARASVFCSMKCARAFTQAKTREEARDRKRDKVLDAIGRYQSLKADSPYHELGLRTYVIDVTEGVSKKFITQVIEDQKKRMKPNAKS